MCTFNTDKIYLTWRKDVNKSRHLVGILHKDNDNYSFMYSKENVVKAQKEDGFTNYPAFENIDKVYDDKVIEVFKRRLLNPQRRDYKEFLHYWGADNYENNDFALLGLTGAKLLTDNYEFIAPHQEVPARFNTDISWLNLESDYIVNSIRNLTNSEIEKQITLELEPNNKFDPKAVKVLFDNELLGYIKSIHCENVFDAIKDNRQVELKIANVIKNGTIKEVLLNINIQ